MLSLAAAENAWEHREPALFFSGANLGFPRRNLSLTDWSEVEEVRLPARISEQNSPLRPAAGWLRDASAVHFGSLPGSGMGSGSVCPAPPQC